MADVLVSSPASVFRRFKDMGDGTHAEVTASAAPGGGGLATEATLDRVADAAEDTSTVSVKQAGDVGDWKTWVLDTAALAVGDVMVTAALEIANFFVSTSEVRKIVGLQVLDPDDQGVGFDLFLENAATSLGTQNGAPSISDANAETIMGVIPVDAADYIDLGGVRIAFIGRERETLVKAGGVSTSLWVSGVTRGAPTYPTGLKLKFKSESA